MTTKRSTDCSYLKIEFFDLFRQYLQLIFKCIFLVNKLKQETDVVINIPDNDKGSTTIRIEGHKEGVKKAKEVKNNFFIYFILF